MDEDNRVIWILLVSWVAMIFGGVGVILWLNEPHARVACVQCVVGAAWP